MTSEPQLTRRSALHRIGGVFSLGLGGLLSGCFSRRHPLSKINCAMKNIVQALFNFASKTSDANLPPRAACDGNGKPLLSWRVSILPELDNRGLYKMFRLDEPWDSPHNRKLIPQMPEVLAGNLEPSKGVTPFVFPVGPGTLYGRTKDVPCAGDTVPMLDNIPDGKSTTIMFVRADKSHSVTWTKPDDLDWNPDRPAHGLGMDGDVTPIAMCDGTVRVIAPARIKKRVLKAMFTFDGGERITEDEF